MDSPGDGALVVLVWCLVLMAVAYTYQVEGASTGQLWLPGHHGCQALTSLPQASCVCCCLPEGDFLKYCALLHRTTRQH